MAKTFIPLITICCLTVLALLASIVLSESATTPVPRTVRKTVVRRRKLNSNSSVTNSQPTEPSAPTTTLSPYVPDEIADVESTTQIISTTGITLQASLHHNARRNVSEIGNGTIIPCDDQCDPRNCVRPHDCFTEIVLDHCSCCHVCAAIEGDVCYNSTLNMPFYAGMGICGSSFSCLLRENVETNEVPETQCQCRDTRVICGSDNTTYKNECKLRQAAHLNPNLTIQAWTPCFTAPWITEIDNTTAAVGEEMSLSCEVRAFPWPVIHWQFLEESSSQLHTLPGDDFSVVVTIRGGPEPMMTSSWIQIISVSPRRQGTYFCIASNSEGTTRKQTYVSVYNSSND